VAGREGKRGECSNRSWFLVWRETGAVRNARPSRGQAACTRKRAQWREEAEPTSQVEVEVSLCLYIRYSRIGGAVLCHFTSSMELY